MTFAKIDDYDYKHVNCTKKTIMTATYMIEKHGCSLFWNNKTITYANKDGNIHVIAIATFHDKVNTEPQTPRDLVINLIKKENDEKRKIKSIGDLAKRLQVDMIDDIFQKCCVIVNTLEDALLSPYTRIGKARLKKEFFTLVI